MDATTDRLTLASFLMIAQRIPYIKKGIFYSELYLFLAVCREMGVRAILESGVRDGMSTHVLSAAFHGFIYSVDREFHIPAPGNVKFVRGDALDVIPSLLERHANSRVGILIDGPKGITALALKDACLTMPCTKVVAVHDVAPGHGERLHSFDAAYRQKVGQRLDALIPAEWTAKYPDGPGLGIWVQG